MPPQAATVIAESPVPRLDALTSLRFFAAFSVLLFHVPTTLSKSVGLTLLPLGSLGVGFFFILSGFVLTHVYAGRDFSVKAFYKRRAAKVLPLHYATLLLWIFIFFKGWGNEQIINSGIANFLLIHSFFAGTLSNLGYNAVSWSVSTEIFFYALFPVICRGYRDIALLALYTLVFLLAPHSVMENLNVGFPDFFYFNPLARLLEFVCGIALYRLFVVWKPNSKLSTVAQVGSLSLLVVTISIFSLQPIYLRNLILLVPFASVILTFSRPGLISNAISHPILVILGEASFSLYMTHHMWFKYIDDQLTSLICPVSLVTAIASAVFLSVGVFYIFERPTQAFLTDKNVRSRNADISVARILKSILKVVFWRMSRPRRHSKLLENVASVTRPGELTFPG